MKRLFSIILYFAAAILIFSVHAMNWIDHVISRPHTSHKRIKFAIYFIIPFFATIIIIAASSDLIVSYVANKIYANTDFTNDSEFPVTAHAISYSGEDIQVVGGMGKGLSCSLPPLADFIVFSKWRKNKRPPISLQFRQACVYHDYCYRHGAATYGYSQADCDYFLLKHAFKICKKSSSIENKQIGCATEAKKVLLGVRVGGANSFKPLRKNKDSSKKNEDLSDVSTYFEFDPYPVFSQKYDTYRIADTPKFMQEKGAIGKALYIFNFESATPRLQIIAINRHNEHICSGITLRGFHRQISTAPLVVRSKNGKGFEDWFVWWRRYSLSGTGGNISALPVQKASRADWIKIFPGIDTFPTKCAINVDIEHNQTKPIQLNDAKSCTKRQLTCEKPSAKWAMSNIEIGYAIPDDPSFSELHPVPELEPSRPAKSNFFSRDIFGPLRLISLRTASCIKGVDKNGDKKPRVPCYNDFNISLHKGDNFQVHEPFGLRDEYNKYAVNYKDTNRKLFRYFTSPPFATGTADNLIFNTVVRSDFSTNYNDYLDTAFVRRFIQDSNDKTLAASAGLLRLEKFTENIEPTFITQRTTDTPNLLSLWINQDKNADPKPKINLSKWIFENTTVSFKDAPQDSIIEIAPVFIAHCSGMLEPEWMRRPPMVIAMPFGISKIIFTFAPYSVEKTNPTDEISLYVQTATIDAKGKCELSNKTSALPIRKHTLVNRKETSAETFARLQKRPTLIFEISETGNFKFVIPDPQKPYLSQFFACNQKDNNLSCKVMG